MKTDQWTNVINTNLNGCFFCCRAISKKMIKQKSGKIIKSKVGSTSIMTILNPSIKLNAVCWNSFEAN